MARLVQVSEPFRVHGGHCTYLAPFAASSFGVFEVRAVNCFLVEAGETELRDGPTLSELCLDDGDENDGGGDSRFELLS